MEEQEEKTREIHIATQHDDDGRSQLDHITLDLILEILSKLPAKLLVRSLYVSKLWYSFIRLPSFVNLFASRSSSRPPCLLLTFSLQEKHFVFSFPQNPSHDRSSYLPLYSYQMADSNYWSATLSESVQGLILLWGFVVWNPTLRLFLTLPQPQETISIMEMSYFGYDPLEGKHKILFLSTKKYTDQPWVLTLGAQESWRIITKGCPMHRPMGTRGRCFNGILYYEALIDDHRTIMCFDVNSENFNPIKYSEGGSHLPCHMIPYEGRLALIPNRIPHDVIDLYILKDANRDEWSHERFLHVPPKREFRTYFCFKGRFKTKPLFSGQLQS